MDFMHKVSSWQSCELENTLNFLFLMTVVVEVVLVIAILIDNIENMSKSK